MPEVSVVIVNFNAGPALEEALRSLPRGLEGLDWEAIVVDNASSDGSVGAAEESGDPVRVVCLPENVGFGRGVNAGVARSNAPLVFILNPDCRVEPGAVAALGAELERWPRCALVGPRIVDPDGRLQESARGDPRLLTGLFGRTGLMSRWFPSSPMARRNLVSEHAVRSGAPSVVVEWVSGACMLARREALDQVEGFDPGYFLYWEDADLCRRLRQSNWHIRYVPGASIHHQVGQSSRSVPGLANREFHRSAYRYYITHEVPQRWHPLRPLAWLLLQSRAALKRASTRVAK